MNIEDAINHALQRAGSCKTDCEIEHKQLSDWLQELIDARGQITTLQAKLDTAVYMLTDWVYAVQNNGSGWDDWDEYYKDAAYRPCGIREDLDAMLKLMEDQRRVERDER